MRAVLLACGSRQLAYHPGARAYCRGRVGRALDLLAVAGTTEAIVLHGGAIGPDQWAGEEAHSRGVRAVAYLPSGLRLDTRGKARLWSTVAVHPLDRNRALVAACLAAQTGGWAAWVLGLVAPWPGTGGTDHTLRLARKAGLTVAREVVPAVIR